MRYRLSTLFFIFSILSCNDQGEDVIPSAQGISSDAELFEFITQTDPFTAYALFPGVDSITSGTLNGSTAHQPLVKVRMNVIALGALQGGSLPDGSTFPNGSIIFKEILSGNTTQLYAVIYKDPDNPLAGNGWLWAEFEPDGTPFISMTGAGIQCTGCHAREQGPQNDFVRTFERQ